MLAWAAGIRSEIVACPLMYSIVRPSADLPEELERWKQTPEFGAIVNLLGHTQPDIVLTNTAVHPLPAAAAVSLGIPTLWIINETIDDNPYTALAAALISSHADGIIGTSETTLQPIRPEAGDTPLYLLPPSWHPNALRPRSWPRFRRSKRKELGIGAGNVLIGYIAAAIYPEKGLDHFVRMALQVAAQRPFARFVILGETSDHGYYEDCLGIITNSPYADRFRFIPFEASVQHVYPALDIVVVPSLLPEGFGLTALEGMIFGKAVIAYASGGLAEIQASVGNSAYSIETGNEERLIQVLLDATRSPSVWKKAGIRNGKNAVRVYGHAVFRDRLKKLLISHVLHHRPQYQVIQGDAPDVFVADPDSGMYRRISPSMPEHASLLPQARRIPADILHGVTSEGSPDDNLRRRLSRHRHLCGRRRTKRGRRLRRRKSHWRWAIRARRRKKKGIRRSRMRRSKRLRKKR
ncbi:glycosyltransferase [Paenibacillus popilliae ATCC 14706]|uniref:Glycosyltransferase n=1 Tax=Paenibacillus popilliae ATCC 14706 TaxID=1212764 RepID=M9LRZ0_PAEPP|nr:glycosyltransferase [Paenibacillus popilliae ATCC 14706]